MAQLQNLIKVFHRSGIHNFSYQSKNSKTIKKDLMKSVFISQSNDIFTNLALEDWIYKNYNFANHHILMLWRNDPCVVIGKFQNPWLEASIHNITHNGVQLARRNSGGGTVYHDQGNLNLTFFTERDLYNRKRNLEIVRQAVLQEFNVKLEISSREDLVYKDLKISGTASKLGRESAYHHCTLLVNANKVNLSLALQKIDAEIDTKATTSIKSKIINLTEQNPLATVDVLLKAVGRQFMETPFEDRYLQKNGFQSVNPTEEWFPGITEIRNELCSWDWCYGKTPEFTITKSFSIHDEGSSDNLTLTMIVQEGIISDITLSSRFGSSVLTHLNGQKFNEDILKSLEWSIRENEYGLNRKEKLLTKRS